MNIQEISKIIGVLPLLMVYVVPGYILLRINSFQLSKSLKSDYYLFLESIVVSFVIVTTMEVPWRVMFPGVEPISSLGFKAAVILVAFIMGIFWSRFVISDIFSKILFRLGMNRSIRPGIWSNAVDFEFGLWIMVYITSDKVVYMGKLRRYVELENDYRYTIFLSNYTLFDYNFNTLRDYEAYQDKWVALSSKDITRVEIYYHPRSKKAVMSN